LSTIRNADNIIVFQKGEVVEQGPHEQLVKIENGFYKELVSKQMMQVTKQQTSVNALVTDD
jgi:ATP-binding cassette subfamily B multidrug efflux pump